MRSSHANILSELKKIMTINVWIISILTKRDTSTILQKHYIYETLRINEMINKYKRRLLFSLKMSSIERERGRRKEGRDDRDV